MLTVPTVFSMLYFVILGRTQRLILDALQNIENKTCIRFVRRMKYHKTWLRFKSGPG